MSEARQQPQARRAAEQPSKPSGRAPRIRVINALAIVVAAVLALFALVSVDRVFESEDLTESVGATYLACSNATHELQEASDYLTAQSRLYVATGDREYLDNYIEELLVTDRRGRAVATLHEQLGDSEATNELDLALERSNALAERELYAMRLVAEATDLQDMPDLLADVELDAQDQELDPSRQREIALTMVLGSSYQDTKDEIVSAVGSSAEILLNGLNEQNIAANDELHARLNNMQAIIILLLGIVVLVIFIIIFLILWPLAAYTQQVKNDEPLSYRGAAELQYMANAYNVIYEENRLRTQSLLHAVERDPLTGLYNRGAYDELLVEHEDDIALLLIDVDKFKEVNDTYGHDVGDEVLKKVANVISHSFRGTDFPCRLGGDEFAVIMTDMSSSLRHVVAAKIEAVTTQLLDTSDGLPETRISVGVAFSGAHEGEENIYRAADKALYATKERGRNGYSFFGDD